MANASINMDDAGALLGIFFGISVFLTIVFLNRVQGKVYRMQDYLASRRWHLIKNEKTIYAINQILLVSCWAFFCLPIITLIVWGSGLIARKEEQDRNVVSGVAVFLVGFALIFGLLGVFKIKWNKYRVSRFTGICIIVSIGFLTAYQISTIFIKDDNSFFGLSAIFLTANAVVMILITFINSGITGTSIGEIVAQLPEGSPLDIKRPTNYDDEITECYKNDDYLPTQAEIFEIFTVNRVTKRKRMLGPFEGGISKLMTGLSKMTRIVLTVILYILAVAILLAYALLDYYTRDKSRLGDITMCAVIASDVIMYLYAHSEIVTTPAEISLHIVLFRICLFVLGGSYWIYGYCLLYLYFGSYLAYHIALIRFPFMDEIIEKELEQLNENEENRNSFNIAKTPEFLLFLSTLLFGILLSVMEITTPTDVPLKDYKIETENFEFWVYGLFALLGVLIIFFIILVYRIFTRKINGIDGKVYLYVHYKHLDLFWAFLIGLYFLL